MRTRVAFFLAALLSALVVVLGMGAGPASAEGESIFGFLFQNKAGERVAYEGVKVSATGPDGFKGEATSDEAGRWTIEVPGKGTYTLTLDTDTLPKGVNLTDESKQTLKVPVARRPGQAGHLPAGQEHPPGLEQVDAGGPAHRRGSAVRPDHRARVRRAVADLRHDRADQLRPR